MASTFHVREFVEALAAVHLSSYVQSQFPERGGLMVVGPPGVLKSSLLGVLDRQYGDVLVMSDVNARSLTALRDEVAAGKVRTLVFPEMAKLYDRKSDTAQNIEGVLRALASEGFLSASFEDSRISRFTARATIIGAMTPAFNRRRFEEWNESGFCRRFLWSFVRLHDPYVLRDAVIEGERLSFGVPSLPPVPAHGLIPDLTTAEERRRLTMLLKYQPGGDNTLQLVLLTKMLAVLRWWYRELGDPRSAYQTIEHFAQSLWRDGAELVIDRPGATPQRRAAQRRVAERAEVSAAARRLSQVARKKNNRKRKGSRR
jgi:predicted kinase